MAGDGPRGDGKGVEGDRIMEHLIRTLEWPIGWMQTQIEQVSSFLWHYYLVLLVAMAMFSSVTTRICVAAEREGESIRASSNPIVQCLGQLNEVTSKLKKP